MSVSSSRFFRPRGRGNRAPYWVFGFMARAVQNVLGKIPNPDATDSVVLTIISLIIAARHRSVGMVGVADRAAASVRSLTR